METKVISLGGSLLVPGKVDTSYIKKIRNVVVTTSKKKRIALITGGGMVCRDYINAAKTISKIKDIDADWIGIAATKLNAEMIRSVFGDLAYEKVITNPTLKPNTNKNIIIGSGWLPNCSSDMDAVLLAITLKADTVINLTNIDYVYDKDPRKFKDAKPIKQIQWKEYLRVIGTKWKAGMNYPFDPVASKKAMKHKIKVVIANGRNITNVKAVLAGKEFKGTVIH